MGEIKEVRRKSNQLMFEEEKKYIFKLYENIKKDNTLIDNIIINDLIKILAIEQEELRIHNLRINQIEEKT